MAGLFLDADAATLGACREATQRLAFLDVNPADPEFVHVCTIVVLGIGNGRFEHLLENLRRFLGREIQDIERSFHRLSANLVCHQATLLGRNPDTAQDCLSFHLVNFPLILSGQHGAGHLRHEVCGGPPPSALGLLVGGVPFERASQREFTQLVTHHVLVDEHRNVLLAVVDGNGQTNMYRRGEFL
mgnify:CR=1 FL=1